MYVCVCRSTEFVSFTLLLFIVYIRYNHYGHELGSMVSRIFMRLHDIDFEHPERNYGNVIYKHMALFFFALINTVIWFHEVMSKFTFKTADKYLFTFYSNFFLKFLMMLYSDLGYE